VRGRRAVLLGFDVGSTSSRTGGEGICCIFSCSDKRRHSLFVLRVELIEPSNVKVPRAKTDAVTMDRAMFAIMFDWNKLITYC